MSDEDCRILVEDANKTSSQLPTDQPPAYSSIPVASDSVSALRIPIRLFGGTAIRLEEAAHSEPPPTYDATEGPPERESTTIIGYGGDDDALFTSPTTATNTINTSNELPQISFVEARQPVQQRPKKYRYSVAVAVVCMILLIILNVSLQSW